MLIQAQIAPEKASIIVKTIGRDFLNAKNFAMEWYVKMLIMRHFAFGNNVRYGYPPLTPRYAAWKKKYFGTKPMLVLTGKLAQAVSEARVDKRNASIKIDIPEYGIYQLDVRDFITPNLFDELEIRKVFNRELNRLRKIRANSAKL